MPIPTLGVMTAKEEDSRDETGGAIGFGQRRALPPSSGIALPVRSRIWGGQRGQTASRGFQPGATARVGTRG